MNNFTDSNGQTWAVDIDGDAIERVRDETGIDLLTYGGGITADHAGVATAAEVLWAICRPQAAVAGVDKVAFLASVYDHFAEAVEALVSQVQKGA